MAFKHFWVQYKLGKTSDQAYIKAETFVIGRAPECDLPIPTDILSRRHLKIFLEDEKIFITDLGSTNGTYLQGQRLEPNEKYEYVTGNRLYLDAGKECSLRITAIYQRDIVDMDIEQRGLELEKKRHELRSKGKISRNLKDVEARERFVANASSSVDNIFDNLFYIAKSARFNKEKKIREAEHLSQEMLEKAQKEIETQRALLEKELKSLQVQTKKEANRILKAANEKAAQHMNKAEARALRLHKEAKENKEKILASVEEKRQEIIDNAQEKHAEIIAEAHIRNKELKEESARIDSEMGARRDQVDSLDREIKILQKTAQEHRELTAQTQEAYSHELSGLNSLKAKVLGMEKRNEAALEVLESKIPGLEKKAARLDQEIFDYNIQIKKKETEVEKYEKTIEELQADLLKSEEKATAAERRMDELNDKVIEAEDNLFRLNKIKQQRNEEIDREIAERREKQKQSEEKTAEKLARRREKVEREIEVNLAKAKEQAQALIDEGQKEADLYKDERIEEADTYHEEKKQAGDKYFENRRSEADSYYHDKKAGADTYHNDRCKEADDYFADKQVAADQNYTQIKNEADEYYGSKKQEADEYYTDKKEEADNYSHNLVDEAEREAQRIIAQARLEETEQRQKVDQDLQAAKDESKTLRSEAKAFDSKIRSEANAYAKRVREEADIEVNSRRKNFELEIQEAKDRLLAESRKEAKRMKEKSRAEADAILQEARDEAEAVRNKSQSQADRDLAALQAEIEKKQKETDEEIQSIRSHAVQKMEEQRQQLEKDELEKNRLRVLRLRKDLNEVLRARIVPYLKDPAQVEKISNVMNKSVNAILLDEVDDESFDAENYSDIDPTLQQNKVKKFYIAAGASVGLLVLLFIFAPTLEQLAKDSGRDIATQIEKEDQKQIEAAQKANDLSAEFNPEMVDEFLPTYTERVMYMKGYLRLENDPGFKGQWHVELEEFFVDKLRLTETDMVPFVAREAALITELGEARKKINGNFVEEGRKRLEEIEANFYKRVKNGGLTQKQLDQIMKFKEKFFNENKELFSG